MTKKVPKRKARPGVDGYGRTPLHYAAQRGDHREVQQLLAGGASAGAQDDNGWAPLHFAVQASSAACVEALIAARAPVDARDSNGNTPLLNAVFGSRGDGTLIALLRAAGADPNLANTSGVTPLSLARTIANYDVARFFADLG